MQIHLRRAAAALVVVWASTLLAISALAGPPPRYQFEFINYPGADITRVVGVRSDGVAIGEFTVLGPTPPIPPPIFEPRPILDRGFLYLFDGSSVSIIDPPGDETFTLLSGVSDDGLVLGNQFTNTSSHFLFDGTDYHPLAIPGAAFVTPAGINGDGVIWGGSSLGSFIAKPVPEPATAALLSLGLAFALRATRSHSRRPAG